MRKRGKRQSQGSPLPKSPILLDEFPRGTLQQWRKKHQALHDSQTLLYFDLEGQRSVQRKNLHEALNQTVIPFSFEVWFRVVNYRYTLHPLSLVGSLINSGRFNFGEDIDSKTFKPFPALYLANSDETARAEYFQVSKSSSPLKPEDFRLTNKLSYSVVALKGNLNRVFDLRKRRNLRPFVETMKHFTIAERVQKAERTAGIKPSKVVKTTAEMYNSLMLPNWRIQPMQYDVASNSQIFGDTVCGAGIQGIVYGSARSSGACLAIFPQNLDSNDAYVEIASRTPDELPITRLDWTTWRELIEE